MLHPGLSPEASVTTQCLIWSSGKRGQSAGSLHRVFYVNCAGGNPEFCQTPSSSGAPRDPELGRSNGVVPLLFRRSRGAGGANASPSVAVEAIALVTRARAFALAAKSPDMTVLEPEPRGVF